MAATALVAARIEPELKMRSQTILQRSGITDSQLIRHVYEYIAFLDDVPEFLLTDSYRINAATGKRIDPPGKFKQMLDAIESNPFSDTLLGLTDDDLKAALDEGLSAKIGADDE